MPGKLVVCPTPIGNLEDITMRARRALHEADVIAYEGARVITDALQHRQIVPYARQNAIPNRCAA